MRCLIQGCRDGQCPACLSARCAWCKRDTRFTQIHTVHGFAFCGPSNNSPCRWYYFQRNAEAA
jgi:hypothetical protein